MPIYAVLNSDNVVINRIVADSLEVAEENTGLTCILCDGTSRNNATWDGIKFVYPEPEPIIVEELTIEE